MYNPLHIAGAKRRHPAGRHRVGAEFGICPDGTQVKGNPTPEKCGYIPPVVVTTPTGGGTGSGWGPGPTPPRIDEWTPPPTTGGGPIWTPPTPIPTPSGCMPVQPVCPENLKRYWMPFTPGSGYTVAVAAGAIAVFVGEPQKPFKGDRLIIGSGITPYFDVISLEIANIPQSLGSGAVPADMFSEVSTYTEMTFDPAGPGIRIVLTVKNKSSVSQNFQASLTGIAIG